MSQTSERQLIREALLEMLEGNLEGVKLLKANRYLPIWNSDDLLPAVLIYTRSESAEIFVAAPRQYKRTIQLAIEIVAYANDKLDELLDKITRDIEKLIFVDDTLKGTANDCILTGIESDLNVDGERPIGANRLLFDVTYLTFAPEEQRLKDFEGVDFEINTEEGDAIIEGSVDIP